jgi:hypothetical protein
MVKRYLYAAIFVLLGWLFIPPEFIDWWRTEKPTTITIGD